MRDNMHKGNEIDQINDERQVHIMLMTAWFFMGIAILAAGLLLGDLKREMECDKIVRKKTEGDRYGVQETAHQQGGEFLRRCS